jgi:hypothetical protein
VPLAHPAGVLADGAVVIKVGRCVIVRRLLAIDRPGDQLAFFERGRGYERVAR